MISDWISAGWPIVRIREIGSLYGGGTPSRQRHEYFRGTIPWITGQDIPESHVAEITAARDYVTDEAVQESATRVVPAGAVLLTTRVSVGKAAVAGCPICFSQDITAIIIHSAAIAPAYVAHYLRARRAALLQKNQGSTIAGITRDSLALEQIPIPPLSEQKRIVEILQEAEEIRRLRVEAEARTAALVPALYHRLFGVNRQSSGWPEVSIREIAKKGEASIRTGPFGSDLLHSEFVDAGVAVLGIDNVVSNRFRWAERRYITSAKYADLTRFRVFAGDVMVTIMGTVGRVAIAPPDLPEAISTKHLCVITPETKRVLPTFLWAALHLDRTLRSQTRAVAKGAIMEGWNSRIIKALRFRLPPIKLQESFDRQVKQALDIETSEDSRSIASCLTESLYAHAFSGQLTAGWRKASQERLSLEAQQRDAALREAGAFIRSSRATLQEEPSLIGLPNDGIYSNLNREQRSLLANIQQNFVSAHQPRYFSAQSLSSSIEGTLRRNYQIIEGHLAVLAARGLLIPVSREEETADTGEHIFGNAYRLPLLGYEQRLVDDKDEPRAGDHTRLRELERLAALLGKGTALP